MRHNSQQNYNWRGFGELIKKLVCLLILGLLVNYGCVPDRPTKELLSYTFANGVAVTIKVSGRYDSDGDVPYGWTVFLDSTKPNEGGYIGRLTKARNKFRVDKIVSEDEKYACFFSNNVENDRIMFVYDSDLENPYSLSHPLRGTRDEAWGKRILAKIDETIEQTGTD